MLAVSDSPHHPPCPRPFNMAAHVLGHAARQPDKPALAQIGGATWSYARLEAAVRGTATGFLRLGLVPGDRVLLRLGNSVDFPVAYLGAIAAGLVPAPTSAALTKAEITPMAGTLAPRVVVQDEGVSAPDLPGIPVIDRPALRDMRALPPAEWHMGDPDRPAYIVFTSGTSAGPRGVIHAHRAVWARGTVIRHWADMTESDRILHAGAFNWTYTLGTGLMDPWTVGATALIPAEGTPAEDLPRLLTAEGATIFAAVPGIFRKILRQAPPPIPTLRHALSAGEKLPDTLRDDWRLTLGTEIHEAYGQSECSTFISGSPLTPAPPGRLGRAQPGRQVAILGPDGPVGRDVPGALAVAADDPGLMLGYLGATDDAQHGPWRLTGDIASMDAEGWITYLGRDDDVMTAGGYRVSPLEVEAVAAAVPGVTEAASFEREVAPGVRVIALAYGAADNLDEAIRAACDAALAGYKRPRIIERRETLPRNPNGKLQRRALREEAQ